MDSSVGTFEKLKKTAGYVDLQLEEMFQRRFGISNITFDTLESVYDPAISGIGSMEETRSFLVKEGMTLQFADILAARYLKKVEENSEIVQVM